MEVVQTGPLVCASRPSSSHPPPHPRLSHRIDADPTSALHVQTEEGGGGLDPSWWKISASGSWDGGERRMRYGKLIDDRSGSIPGAVQRRKLEMLETHAPGASMRVVHSQSHASWVQDPSDVTSTGLNTSISSSRRSVLSSSSSSTRVTSFRQWSSNFTQNSTNSVGLIQEARPSITEFGNLELALNPLDVSFLRTRGNVGRSGSIGARRPPSRGRRLSTDVPSDSSAGDDHSKTPSPIPRGDGGVRTHDISNESRVETFEDNSNEETESRSEWTPSSSKTNAEADEKSNFARRLQTVLHRKRSVSSEDVRTADGTDEEDPMTDDTEGKWRRGAAVRRSLPSSEWRSVVAAADETRQRLRPRDPFKSSSVPALGGTSSRRESFVTAESLREMKGRLKHRDGTTDSIGRSKTRETPSKNGEAVEGGEETSSKPRPTPFFLRAAARESPPGTRQQQEIQDDRRKSWSVGCRNVAKRSFEEESEGILNRRRSYAFEYAAEENESTEDKENSSVGRALQEGRGDAQRDKLWVDPQPYVQNRVNEVLKKWSALSKEEESRGKEDLNRTSEKSPMVNKRVFEDRRGDSPVKNSTTWLENSDFQANSVEEAEFSQATTTSGSRTTFRVIPSKSPLYKDEMISDSQEKGMSDSSFSVSGEPMEDYMSAHGLTPIDWADEESKILKEAAKTDVGTTSAGISVTFSNNDLENNSRHHFSVTHLDNREGETTKSEVSKMRTSKKVEFSKTEVHFAAESGRFHIVETAGKPPPSNNFRRRRRSPTGTMNVDSGRVGTGVGSQSAITNGMRFGDSPYEMRLLAGSENLEHASRINEEEYVNEQNNTDDLHIDGEESLDYKPLPSSKMKVYNELVIEEERDSKEILRKISETDSSNSSSTFLHLGLEESSEKPRSILRNTPAENLAPWKITLKDVDDLENDDSKPKFGGVRLRPVSSTIGHLRVNVTNTESQDPLNSTSTDKAYSCALSPGQMELQKLLRSLRHVSMTYNDGPSDSNPTGAQVANGGGMEVRISSASQPAVTNTVIIGGDLSEANAPLSVAQRVREVEERRQKELLNKVATVQKPATRASGQFSTRVTLGSASSSVVSLESQVPRKTSVSQIENANPVSTKSAEKVSTHNNKIARIHNAQDKVGQLRVVRKGIREEICRQKERTQYRATSEERALKPEPTAITPIIPLHGGRNPPSPSSIRVEQPSRLQEDWKKKTPSEAEGLWRGNWPPTPSASWPSARGFGRVGDDRVMLKSPSLILQTMLNTAFSAIDKDKSTSIVGEVCKKTEIMIEVDKIERIAREKHSETLMSGDKLQPKLSILRALYRDASEEEGSDAPVYEEIGVKSLDGFAGGGSGGLRTGDGGSVVSGSWRRLRRSKQPPKRAIEESSTPSTSVPKPVPRRQAGQAVARTKQRPSGAEEEPPMPPPRTRNNAQRVKRSDGKGGGSGAGGRERVQERRRGGGSGRGGECGGKGIASRLSGDVLQHNQVAATSDIKISAHLTENHTKIEHSKEVPMVTCISLGFQGKAKDGLKQTEARDEAKGKPEQLSISGSKIDGSTGENPKRIATKAVERKIEGREKSPEVAMHSRAEKYSISSPTKDASSSWRSIDSKNKEQDDRTKTDISVQGVRSPKRGRELSSDVTEKSHAKTSFTSLGSPTAVNKSFQSDTASFQRYKEESRIDDVAGQFSIKMKVIKNNAEEKSAAVLDPTPQGSTKTNSQCDYLHQRRTNTITTSSKFSENESSAQKSKKESSPRVTRESRTVAMQVSKSPTMDQKSKLQTRSSRSGNPETSSPSSGRAVRKRLRKRGSGGTSKPLSSSDRRKEGVDDDSAILEELTKAADEILHAVNGYSDEVSSDEEIETSKSESRTKRRQAVRKEISSRKLSSSSGKDPKGGGSLRNTNMRTKEGRTRITNGTTSPSAEGVQGISPETQTSETPSTYHGINLGSPIASPKLHARSSNTTVVSEKSQRSRQQSLLAVSKKSMTRIEPTNRVAEVKLIEKRPPLPPAGQRRPSGTKERSEALGRGSHGKTKASTSLVYNKDGEAEIIKETKRPLNIARALEAVMPESRTKTRKIDQKMEISSALKVSEIQKKDNPTSSPTSAQSSPSASHSLDRKKVASSRDGDKTTRRRAHQNITSPT